MANNANLREAYNSDEPIEILYKRINKCADYVAVVAKPVIEGQIIQVSYRIVAKTG